MSRSLQMRKTKSLKQNFEYVTKFISLESQDQSLDVEDMNSL